ncbi:hypothetical protein FNV43_RR17299 [Rhamnella rubrinervis]|uniref:Protein kinase domain-containing protein n=1 Tax=Rhamnella rubrinervis TaxID=2594499 RepID=A0A8K0E3V7_9ROSA|nr:hypothetical protein FNV43_RR17299 [Rhamnella rubrinervis]
MVNGDAIDSWFPVSFLDYQIPVKYFINCGSKSNVEEDSARYFVGDGEHSSSFNPGRQSKSINDHNPSTNTSVIYHTARVYGQPSSYELDISENGTYFIRLHFFAFNSRKINLADAQFNVSTSKFLLLSNFAGQNTSNSPVVEEFLLTINVSKFCLYFIPHGTSFAFVNAIEVFLAPQNLTKSEALRFTPTGQSVTYHGFQSDALHTVHRVNVGGPTKKDLDLWRHWISDDAYLHEKGLATNKIYEGVPFYQDFVIDSDDSGFLEISICPREDSPEKKAFLNGLEIMELMKETDFIPPLPLDMPKHHLRHVIVGSVSSLAFVTFLVGMVFLGHKYNKAKHAGTGPVVPCGGWTLKSGITRNTSSISSIPNCDLKLKMPFTDILHATQNFDPRLVIGEGGFGKVYKGTLKSGLKVAVKRSDPKHGQGLPEFQTEVTILSKIRHLHLVSLIGYCKEGSEMILVYEFMEGGTLREHLYTSENNRSSCSTGSKLSWKQRLEICIGSAKGLHYLHTGINGGIIHCDVKSTNILLNEHYLAKVADFGLSRSGPLDPDHFSIGIKGSFGYLDPEYITCFQFTDKSDVYSFGVVLLEVLCSRPAIINSPRMDEVNLAEWGMYWHKEDKVETIIDPCLVGQVNPNSLRKFVEIAEKCLKRNGIERPTMYDVWWDLEYALQLQKGDVLNIFLVMFLLDIVSALFN